jgi:polysaccharide export outer membrane protein
MIGAKLRLPNMGVFLVAVSALAGCGALPNSGPFTAEVINEGSIDSSVSNYIVVDVDERIANIWAKLPRDSFSVFGDVRPAPDLRIGVGDGVAVTIWEAAAGGLFSAALNDKTLSAGSRTAGIPEQIVPSDGTIQVPYAGRLKVTGLRPADVEALVVERLKGKAIEPQAVVTITRNVSNAATVTGEVVQGARVPLTPRGDRVLDVIASAGGIRAAAHETFIRITRKGSTVSVGFNRLLASPPENIYVHPDDTITVVRIPQTFSAFGTTGRNASVPFDASGITLEEAIARAGGLIDELADPTGVFLLRFEPIEVARQLAPAETLSGHGQIVPVVYRINMRETKSFFLARSFQIRDKDILYVSASTAVPVRKFLNLVNQAITPAASAASLLYITKQQ